MIDALNAHNIDLINNIGHTAVVDLSVVQIGRCNIIFVISLVSLTVTYSGCRIASNVYTPSPSEIRSFRMTM
jgi:hypothetical protein